MVQAGKSVLVISLLSLLVQPCSALLLRTQLLPLQHRQRPQAPALQYSKKSQVDVTTTAEKTKAWDPPRILQNLRVGGRLFVTRILQEKEHRDFEIQRLALDPPIYLLRGVLSADECQQLVHACTKFDAAKTASGTCTARPHCHVSWLSNASNELAGRLARAVGTMVLSSEAVGTGAGNEDLQVVRYDRTGEYALHHDGNDRIVTVLYYLNDVGGTWFPLAQKTVRNDTPAPQTRAEALLQTRDLVPGVDGILLCRATESDEESLTASNARVTVQTGDAVVFYNYCNSNDGPTGNWNAIHAGMPAESTKYIANHWFHALDALFE